MNPRALPRPTTSRCWIRPTSDSAATSCSWLTVFLLPTYAPDLNPVEGVWSLLKRSVANLAATNLDHLVRVVERKLKKIQYRPHLLEGCLAETGLTLEMP